MTATNRPIGDEDRALLSSLYKTFGGKMLHAALGVLKNYPDAEDAVMNTFVALSRNTKTLPKEPDRLCAYLIVAAKNHALNLLRKRQRSGEVELFQDISDQNSEEKMLTELSRKQDARYAATAIARLGDEYASVLMYKYLYNLTIGEIAKLLDRNRNSVKSTLRRGKAKLLELLKEGETE